MKKQIPNILKQIRNQNKGYQIKLRYRKNPSGLYRLYLDYWDGQKRATENLKLYISATKADITSDKNVLKLALSMRNKKEIQLMEGNTGIQFSSAKKETNFIEFFRSFADTKSDTNYRISYDHFTRFYKKDNLPIKKVDYELSEKFVKYLLSLDITRYTAHHYLVAYKATLNQAVRLRKIDYNPAKLLKIRYESKNIERLTLQELQKLHKTNCKYPDIKNGFLFSCFTGLRISDIRNLKFSDIKNGHIEIILKKNKTEVSIKLNESAKKILKEQKERKVDKFVFHIPQGGKTSNRLKEWIKQAGIQKKITYHCSRHTFGCLLIENGVDVFTVKKLMGHKDVKTTLKYVDKVDETRDKGIDKLPNL